MPTFVRLSRNQRKLFFTKLKEKIGTSWDTFYPKYGKSRAMFFNYLSGQYDIPQDLFNDWKKINRFSLGSVQKINKQKYIQKEIPKIKLDEKFAEILGILNGDGHISLLNYEISVIGNSKEIDYLDYIKNLFERTLGIDFKLSFGKGAFKIRAYSSKLFNLLIKEYELPDGNKMGKLRIPLKIKKNKRLLIRYIRGLFDTDGTFYLRRNNEPVIEISSGDKRFLSEIKETLYSLNFKIGIGEHRVFMYNKEDVRRFFNLIKPANTKHLKKYKEYLKLSAGGPENSD